MINVKQIEIQIGNLIRILEEISVLQAEAKIVKKRLKRLQKGTGKMMTENVLKQLIDELAGEMEGINQIIVSKMRDLNSQLEAIKEEVDRISKK